MQREKSKSKSKKIVRRGMYSKILEEYFSSSSGVMVDLVEDRKMLLVLCERYGSVVRISLHGVMGGGHL